MLLSTQLLSNEIPCWSVSCVVSRIVVLYRFHLLGLNYISLNVGFFLGTQICAPINDCIYRKLKMRNNNIGRPEFRVPLMIPGACLVPIGLFIYGWTSFYQMHWIVPNIGAAIFATGYRKFPLCDG